MASALDVAEYILQQRGPITSMKLQKLVYYCQAWSLVWDERPMFDESVEAWANGPVVRELYDAHRGLFEVRPGMLKSDTSLLDTLAKETIDSVLGFYGDKSSQWLVDLTHFEDPWRNARRGLRQLERSDRIISHDVMAEYYGTIAAS